MEAGGRGDRLDAAGPALIDATRAIDLFRKMDVPILGLIENMSGYACPHCGGSPIRSARAVPRRRRTRWASRSSAGSAYPRDPRGYRRRHPPAAGEAMRPIFALARLPR